MLLLTDKIILHLEETFRSQYACHGCRDEFMGPMLTLLFLIIPLLVHELFDMFNGDFYGYWDTFLVTETNYMDTLMIYKCLKMTYTASKIPYHKK